MRTSIVVRSLLIEYLAISSRSAAFSSSRWLTLGRSISSAEVALRAVEIFLVGFEPGERRLDDLVDLGGLFRP